MSPQTGHLTSCACRECAAGRAGAQRSWRPKPRCPANLQMNINYELRGWSCSPRRGPRVRAAGPPAREEIARMPAAAPKPLWPTSGHRSSARGDAGKASPISPIPSDRGPPERERCHRLEKTPVADPRRAPSGSRRKRRRRLVSPPWPPWPGALWMAPFTRGPASATQSIRKHPGRPQATGRPRGASDAVAGKTLRPLPGARPLESSVMNLWNSCLPFLHAAERHVLILPMGKVRKQRVRCWRSQVGSLRLQSRKPFLLPLGARCTRVATPGPALSRVWEGRSRGTLEGHEATGVY